MLNASAIQERVFTEVTLQSILLSSVTIPTKSGKLNERLVLLTPSRPMENNGQKGSDVRDRTLLLGMS